MKKIMFIVLALSIMGSITSGPTFPANPFKTEEADAAIKRISGYTRSNGTYVKGHYRDTSNDGNRYNNANYLGYND